MGARNESNIIRRKIKKVSKILLKSAGAKITLMKKRLAVGIYLLAAWSEEGAEKKKEIWEQILFREDEREALFKNMNWAKQIKRAPAEK